MNKKANEPPSPTPMDDELVRHLAETSDLSPLQAVELIRLHGRDRHKLDEIAKTIKDES